MEVRINGIAADLGGSFPAITRKSINPNNISIRHIDITNKFKLPDTNINRQIFDSPAGVGTNNRSFDKLYNVTITDTFEIFSGKGFLSDSDSDTFSFQVVDKSKDLFTALDVPLNSIDWSDLYTDLSQTSINTLDSASEDHCLFWGKACYHNDPLKINTDLTTGDGRCKYSRPSLYVHGLLKRAIELQGYTYTANDVDLAIGMNNEKFYFTSYQKTMSATYNPSGTLAMTLLSTADFEHGDLTTTSTTIAIGTKKTMFRVRGSVESDAIIYMIIRAIDDVDSSKISESKFTIPIGTNDIDFYTSEFQSDDGITIDIRFEGTGELTFTAELYTNLEENEEDLSTNPWLDYRILIHDNLPDITYHSLLKLICVIGNCFPSINNREKAFAFGSFSGMNKMNSVDWSNKFIQRSEKINPDFSSLCQCNYLKYENDETISASVGLGSFSTDNESLDGEGDYITIQYSASKEVTIDSNDIVHINLYNNTGRIPDQSVSMRLFWVNSDKLQFNQLQWTALAANYYSALFDSLYRVRAISCEMNLSKLDVLSWSENKLVYIDYFKSTFIVLEINNFIPGRSTSVQLLNYGRT